MKGGKIGRLETWILAGGGGKPVRWVYDFFVIRFLRNRHLFCPLWYWREHPEAFSAIRKSRWYALSRKQIPLLSRIGRFVTHPASHYVRCGAREGLSPCIFFDTVRYREAHAEVAATGINPLLYCLRNGGESAGGRIALSPNRLSETRKECFARLAVTELRTLPASSAIQSAPRLRIAVHLHLFYPEMLQAFLNRLRNIPGAFDLFVSVASDTVRQPTGDRLKAAFPASAITVETVPNRGRDLAPLIVQFGERLLDYDVICHIHSKKSPHDRRLSGWLARCLASLLGSRERVAGILELLQSDAKIVYPAAPAGVSPDPATGWSCNYDEAERLLKRCTCLDLRQFPIVEFPHGSMFWARQDALKLLLTLPLTFDDFPPEPIPPDGTLAHALERLLLVLCSDVPGKACRLT